MTTEELLRPRWKVLADYPRNPFEVGNILETDDKGVYTLWEHDGKDYLTLSDYPSIFKRLDWWEERDEKDLPNYVKYKGCEMFRLKVNNYQEDCVNHNIGCDWISLYEPATEEEYLQSLL